MPIELILAIIELIIKLPAIVKTIRDIIAAIHRKPHHLRGALLSELEEKISDAHAEADAGNGEKQARLIAFAVKVKAA